MFRTFFLCLKKAHWPKYPTYWHAQGLPLLLQCNDNVLTMFSGRAEQLTLFFCAVELTMMFWRDRYLLLKTRTNGGLEAGWPDGRTQKKAQAYAFKNAHSKLDSVENKPKTRIFVFFLHFYKHFFRPTCVKINPKYY